MEVDSFPWHRLLAASSLAPKCLIFNQSLGSFWFYSWICFKLCFSLLTKVRIQGSLNQGKKASSLYFCFLTFNFPSLSSSIIFKNSEHIKNTWNLFGFDCFCTNCSSSGKWKSALLSPELQLAQSSGAYGESNQTFWTTEVCLTQIE